MKKARVILSVILAALLLLVGGMVWLLMNYHLVNFRLYDKTAQTVDLREEEISVKHYDKLAEKMPDAEIYWNVPFQGGVVTNDTQELTITSLTEEDVLRLDYLENLKTVDATQCTDYAQLAALRERRPEVEVNYLVHISEVGFDQDANRVELDSITPEEMELLQYLPELSQVVVLGTENTQNIDRLQSYCADKGIEFCLSIGGEMIRDEAAAVTLTGVTDEELNLLPFLTRMKELHIIDPAAAPETVFALQENLKNVDVTWEVTVAGIGIPHTQTEVDLTQVEVTDLGEVEQKMAYLPDLVTVTFGVCGIDEPKWGNSKSKLTASPIENEDMAAYRDRVREDYKVVWTLRLGPSIALRSDADNFMPNHFGVGQLPDNYAYNLRYCEEMVCLDVGHMTLTDISFVEFMPNLKYLILAWTEVQYIEPIRTCKNLVFLELDNSCIRDLSPLVGCTALEDLNLGNTFCDVTPILEMTWLKNVYFILGSKASAWKVSQAIPTAHVVASGDATVGGGWRRLPNYYDMRDCLGMYYMN